MPTAVIRTSVNPTEDVDRVRQAILSLFPEAKVEEEGGEMVARTDDLAAFKERIRKQRILDTTRSMMFKGRRANETRLRLNKQVASVGSVSYVEGEVPLGALEVSILADDVERAIDDIAPRTVDGEEV